MARINMETLEKAIAARADGTHAPEPVSEVIARGRRGIFNLFDKDRSGRIDTFKLGACFSVLGIEYNADLLKVLLRHFDADRNGTLELEEFSNLVVMLQTCKETARDPAEAHVAFSDAQMAKFEAAFASLDADGSGNIDASELSLALEQLGIEGHDPKTIDQMIEMIDVDGDREVNFDEFLTLMRMSSLAGGGDGDKDVSIQAIVKDSLQKHYAKAREATRVQRIGVTAAMDAHKNDGVDAKQVCGDIAAAVTRAAGGSADDGCAAKATAEQSIQEAIDEELCAAAERGKLEGLDRAVEHGARVNAARAKPTNAAAALGDRSSTSMPSGQTPLHLATATQQLECAARLLELGADPIAADQEGWTPLMNASKSQKFNRAPKSLAALLDACAAAALAAHDAAVAAEKESAEKTHETGRKRRFDPAADRAARARRDGVARGAIVGALSLRTRSGFTALHSAVAFDRTETAAALVKAGADANVQTEEGVTPLMRAATLGLDRCIEILLRGGADPTMKDLKGATALGYAERSEQLNAQETMKKAAIAWAEQHEQQEQQEQQEQAAAATTASTLAASASAGALPNGGGGAAAAARPGTAPAYGASARGMGGAGGMGGGMGGLRGSFRGKAGGAVAPSG